MVSLPTTLGLRNAHRRSVPLGLVSLVALAGACLGLIPTTAAERSMAMDVLLVCVGLFVGWAKAGSA